MKIIFCSNYFTHHQKPLSDQLDILSNNHFSFVGYKEMDTERTKLGWSKEEVPAYVQNIGEITENQLVQDTDVLIAGSFPEPLLLDFMKKAKLVFRYSERPLKKGNSLLKYPIRFLRWHYYNPSRKHIRMLCASAFTAGDYAKFGLFTNQCYKWGYFPESRQYSDMDKLFSNKSTKTIIWCGRFLDWKHPDDAVELACRLKKLEIPFELKLIGTGPLEDELHLQVQKNELQDCVKFMGTMSPDQVRNEMEQAGIFIFTSDRQEGWGAVLNEAMNSGCAVVASDAIGAVPYLIKDEENGRVYHSGRIEELCKKVKSLLENPKRQRYLGEAAYYTITELWNAKVAAERFVVLAQSILDGDPSPDLFESGPCSRAEMIQEDWYQG